MNPFNMLMLGIQTLVEAGGDPDPFLQEVRELQKRWAELQVDIGVAQQFIYDAVRFEWEKQGKNE